MNKIKKFLTMNVVLMLTLVIGIALTACGDNTVAVESVSINGSDIAIINVEEPYSVAIAPDNASNKTIAWEVVSGTATISQNGLLTATATGTVTIKATVDGKSDTKQITVNNICFGIFEYSVTIEDGENDGVLLTNRLILNEDYTGQYLALFNGIEVGGHFSQDITFSVDGDTLSYTIGDEPPISGIFSNYFNTLTLTIENGAVVLNRVVDND